jgi:hypothetical protein
MQLAFLSLWIRKGWRRQYVTVENIFWYVRPAFIFGVSLFFIPIRIT